jgi:hypothetical protein
MESLEFRLTGTSPLLLNNPQTVDTLSEASVGIRELTSKRKRSEAEDIELRRQKFMAGLYLTPDGAPYIPAYNIQRAAQEAGRLSKQGKIWERGVWLGDDKCLLNYSGPKTAEGLWNDRRFVDNRDGKVGSGARIVVTRPIFPEWSCDVTFHFEPEIANPADILIHLVQAGRMIGVGTYRARFGRFTVSVIGGTVDVTRTAEKWGVEVISSKKKAA